MYGMEEHSTYKGVQIYRNGFGEYEATVAGLECVYPTLAQVRHSIRFWAERVAS